MFTRKTENEALGLAGYTRLIKGDVRNGDNTKTEARHEVSGLHG